MSNDNRSQCNVKINLYISFFVVLLDLLIISKGFLGSFRIKMFNSKKFVDFKIKCGTKTFECHKNVLACHSDVFEAMFTNIDMNEARSGEVEINKRN